MNQPNVEVVVLEHQLQQARNAQKAALRQQNIERLRGVRTELAEKRAAFEKLEAYILATDRQRSDLQLEIDAVQHQLDEHVHSRPAVASIPELADDVEVVEWQNSYAASTARLEELRAQRQALGGLQHKRIEAVDLARAVEGLEYSERNLLNALNGSIERLDDLGGVFTV